MLRDITVVAAIPADHESATLGLFRVSYTWVIRRSTRHIRGANGSGRHFEHRTRHTRVVGLNTSCQLVVMALYQSRLPFKRNKEW